MWWTAMVAAALAAPDGRIDGQQQEKLGYRAVIAELTGDSYAELLVNRTVSNGQFVVDLYEGTPTGPGAVVWTSEDLSFAPPVAVGDFDLDGWPDLAVGDPSYGGVGVQYDGRVVVYRGGPAGLETVHSWEHAGLSSERLGQELVVLDLDDDGYPDLLYNALGYDTTAAGALYAAYGSATGLGAPVQLMTDSGQFHATYAVYGVGDTNGDGLDEFSILDRSTEEVWSAGAAGPRLLWSYNAAPYVFQAGGDVNGDGYSDLVGLYQSGGGYFSNILHLAVVPGGPRGLAAQPSWTWSSPAADDAAIGSVAVGDGTGDGKADVVLGASQAGRAGMAYAWTGAAAGLSASPQQTWVWPTPPADFGAAVDLGGDLNGDGIRDLALGAPLTHVNGYEGGTVMVFFGGP